MDQISEKLQSNSFVWDLNKILKNAILFMKILLYYEQMLLRYRLIILVHNIVTL